MILLLPRGMSQGQVNHAKSIIRLAKLYLKESGNGAARAAIASALRKLAEELEKMKDLDGSWPPPRGYRPGTNPDPTEPKPPAPPNPPPAAP